MIKDLWVGLVFLREQSSALTILKDTSGGYVGRNRKYVLYKVI